MERIDSIFEALEQKLTADGCKTRRDDRVERLPGLAATVPMYEDGSGLVLLELHQLSEEESYSLFQSYITVAAGLGEDVCEVLEKGVWAWNQELLLGAFGVDRELKQLYCLYRFLVPAVLTAEQAAEQIMGTLSLIIRGVTDRYKDVTRLAEAGE